MTQLKWIEAAPADENAVFELLEAFYEEERIEFHSASARAALRELLRNPQAGRVFLLKDAAGAANGYLVVAFWHSLEFGGRVALLDELYLAPRVRGQGWAPRTLDMVRDWARAGGAAAVRLEVNHHNKRAMQIYLKAGFQNDKRDMMTFKL